MCLQKEVRINVDVCAYVDKQVCVCVCGLERIYLFLNCTVCIRSGLSVQLCAGFNFTAFEVFLLTDQSTAPLVNLVLAAHL